MYLVATPRIDLINEQIAFLQATAAELGLRMPDLRKVHGKQRRLGNVQRQLADAARDLAGLSHAVVFITHEALRQADLSPFAEWHGRIDEIPDTIRSGTFKAAAAHQHLAPIYDIKSLDAKWSYIEPKDGVMRFTEILNDDSTKQLATFHKETNNRSGLFINIRAGLMPKEEGMFSGGRSGHL
jgi:hypothetical protein